MDFFEFTFMRNAFIGVILISVVSSIIGTYIVTRRMVFIAGGITHTCFGGLGLGYFLGFSPLSVAAFFAAAGALAIEWLGRNKVRKDSAIAVVWALGMALGILFVFLTPGYVPELNTFLFGNVLTVTTTDLWLFGSMMLLLLGIYMFFGRSIIAISFDPSFSETKYLPVRTVNTVMTLLVALSIVLTIRMVGIMLLMSLISIPQITAEIFTKRYVRMMVLSGIFSLLGCLGGLFFAYAISVPASAAIVLLLISIYILAFMARCCMPRKANVFIARN